MKNYDEKEVIKYALSNGYDVDIKNGILNLSKKFYHYNIEWIEQGTFSGKIGKIKISFRDNEIIDWIIKLNCANYFTKMTIFEEKFKRLFDRHEL